MTTNDNIKRVAAYELLTLECRRYMGDLEELLSALREHGVPPQAWLSFEGGQVSDDIKVTAKWTKAVILPPIPREGPSEEFLAKRNLAAGNWGGGNLGLDI